MCGIAGILRFDDQPVTRPRLAAMLAAVRHRGPDGEHINILGAGRCGLVHARLSIIDIAGGAQPMSAGACTRCRGLTVVFNGEIYNHRQLRHRLEARGHRFATDHCDTEVLLHGYREWGTGMLAMFEGMFAFALWDDVQERLLLARDRVGKKPLFRWRRGAEMVFGSLPAAVIAADPHETPAVDRDALRHFLMLGYTDSRTLLTGVTELPAGHYEVIDRTGRAELHAYARPPEQFDHVAHGEHPDLPAETHLRNRLAAAVESRLEADVPMGCFLSGGIDSSVIAALASRSRAMSRQGPLLTFNVRMPGADYDESPRARMVAEHLGTRHLEIPASAGHDVFDDLEKLVALTGEPLADSSILPTYLMSRCVRQHVAVVLSGDGGDEVFGGYERYRALAILKRHHRWMRWLPWPSFPAAGQRSRRARFARLLRAGKFAQPAQQYRSMVQLFSDRQIAALLDQDTRGAAPGGLADWPMCDDPRRQAMLWDFAHYLPFDLLRKVDRAAMAVALEVRCPMLDPDVCLAAARLPAAALLPSDRTKPLLREIARRLGLPSAIVEGPKRGFGVPIGEWFRASMRRALRDYLDVDSLSSLGIDHAAALRLYDQHQRRRADHSHRLFALLQLSLWARWRRDAVSAAQVSQG